MAAAWDIDDGANDGWNDNEDSTTTSTRTGAAHYMIVLHYKGLKPAQFVPQHLQYDHLGKPLMNSFNKTQQKVENATATSVYDKKVVKWTTKMDILNQLDANEKAICNSLKAFLTKNQSAIFYHNANTDQCAQFGGPHLHIVIESEKTANGKNRQLFDITQYKNLKLKVQHAGGYMKCQGVKNIDAVLKHFNTAPRIFMGTNNMFLFKTINYVRAPSTEVYPTLAESLLEGEEEDETVEPIVRNYSGFEEIDSQPIDKVVAKRHASGWDDDIVTLGYESKKPLLIKETDKERYARVTKMLCLRWNAFTIPDMYKAMAALITIDEEKEFINLWNKLALKGCTKSNLETIKNAVEAEYIYKSFAELINEICQQPLSPDEYETPEDSYQYMISWLEEQKICPLEFVQQVFDVMDRKHEKINTLCMIGGSNAGKTQMFSLPIRTICKFIGTIGNRGANSDFVYQECVNKRVIAIDECVMQPANLEDMKLLLGGEEIRVNVKFAGHSLIKRTPCILTGNKDLWVLDQSNAVPMRNRMYYYTVHSVDELKDITKKINPKVWWYLMQLRNRTKYESSYESLISCPTPSFDCDVVPMD